MSDKRTGKKPKQVATEKAPAQPEETPVTTTGRPTQGSRGH